MVSIIFRGHCIRSLWLELAGNLWTKKTSSWENASSTRWPLSWNCPHWETCLVSSCWRDQASSACGLNTRAPYRLPHRCDFEATQALAGPLEHIQHRMRDLSFCWRKTYPTSQHLPGTCHSKIHVIGTKVSSFEWKWTNAIAVSAVFLEYKRGRKLLLYFGTL